MPIASKWLKLQTSNYKLLRDNTDMTPKFFFQKGGVVRVT